MPAVSNASISVTYVTNRFVWSKIESDDFERLAMNLRAIGCPEKTICDLVSTRARRGIEHLSGCGEKKLPFWTAGLRRKHALRESERETSAAREKILASVERALGRDVFIEDGKLMEDLVSQSLVRFLSGPMSEERFWRLASLFSRQEALRDAFNTRTQGVLLEEDEVALKNRGRQFRGELAAVLLPVELEEFVARTGMIKFSDKVRFDATDLSLAEIRKVALIRSQFDDPSLGEWFDHSSLSDSQEREVKAAERQLLGEVRYAQLQRARDEEFTSLFDISRDHHLPRVAAEKAFELRQLVTQEAARIRQNTNLADEERQQQLLQMQTQAQEGILKALGASASAQYLNHGGGWLTNVNSL